MDFMDYFSTLPLGKTLTSTSLFEYEETVKTIQFDSMCRPIKDT